MDAPIGPGSIHPLSSTPLPPSIEKKPTLVTGDGTTHTVKKLKMSPDVENVWVSTQDFFEKGGVARASLELAREDEPFPSEAEVPLEVLEFLQQAERDPSALVDAKQMLERALVYAPMLTPSQKTTLWAVAERVALEYLKSDQPSKAVEMRMMAAKNLPPEHPLTTIPKLLPGDPKLGVHVQQLDTHYLKNHTLLVQKRQIEISSVFVGPGVSILHLEGKLHRQVRKNMQKTLDYIKLHPEEIRSALPADFCSQVSLTPGSDYYSHRKDNGEFSSFNRYKIDDVLVLHFKGIGTIKLGNDPEILSEYNRISINLDSHVSTEQAAEKLNVIFSLLGLGAISAPTREVDQERIKIMQLFRAFYPKQAYDFEKDEENYHISILELRDRIKTAVPEMESKFKLYLDDSPELMYRQEVYPGQTVWAVKGLADEVRTAGGIGLMAGLTADTFTEAAERFCSILKWGALSTQDRFQLGLVVAGASPGADFALGGANSVFTRLVTSNMRLNPEDFALCGMMQILYDLNLVEQVGYCYPGDVFGSKNPSVYKERGNIVELAIEGQDKLRYNNEFCINGRIAPKYVKGAMVRDQMEKKELIAALEQHGLITENETHEKFCSGIPIDDFIHIGYFDEKYWL